MRYPIVCSLSSGPRCSSARSTPALSAPIQTHIRCCPPGDVSLLDCSDRLPAGSNRVRQAHDTPPGNQYRRPLQSNWLKSHGILPLFAAAFVSCQGSASDGLASWSLKDGTARLPGATDTDPEPVCGCSRCTRPGGPVLSLTPIHRRTACRAAYSSLVKTPDL